jgi:signal transduction histidine kinase
MGDFLKYSLSSTCYPANAEEYHFNEEAPLSSQAEYANLFKEFMFWEYPVCVTNEQNKILFTNLIFSKICEDGIAEDVSRIINDYSNSHNINYILYRATENYKPTFQSKINIRTKYSKLISFKLNSFIYERLPKKIWISVLLNNQVDNLDEFINHEIYTSKAKHSGTFSIDEYCARGLNRLCDLFPFEIGFIHYYYPDKDEFVLAANYGTSTELTLPIMKITNNNPDYRVLVDVSLKNRYIITNTITEYPIGEYVLEQLKRQKYNTLMIAPLVFGDKLQGVLTVFSQNKLSSHNNSIIKMKGIIEELSSGIYERTLLYNLIEENLIYKQKTKLINDHNKNKYNYLKDICDDFNKYLKNISGYTSILSLENYKPELAEEKILINDISKNSQKLSTLVSDIQILSAEETSKTNVEYESVSINTLMNEIIGNIEPVLESKNITLNLDYTLENENVYTDPKRLKQIINNLLTSAMKYSVTLSTLKLQLINNEEGLRCTIISKIKEYPVTNKSNFECDKNNENFVKKIQKNEIGLVLVHKLVEIIHGKIEVEVNGSDFLVYVLKLPWQEDMRINHLCSQEPCQQEDNQTYKSEYRCLIIGDNCYSNKWFEHILSNKGFPVSVLNDISDLNNIVYGKDYNIILFNISQKSDILSNYLIWADRNPNFKKRAIIVISKPDNKINAFQLGAVDYFQKPTELDFLIDRINKLIRARNV